MNSLAQLQPGRTQQRHHDDDDAVGQGRGSHTQSHDSMTGQDQAAGGRKHPMSRQRKQKKRDNGYRQRREGLDAGRGCWALSLIMNTVPSGPLIHLSPTPLALDAELVGPLLEPLELLDCHGRLGLARRPLEVGERHVGHLELLRLDLVQRRAVRTTAGADL